MTTSTMITMSTMVPRPMNMELLLLLYPRTLA
jgi:hypothetical protein